MDPQNLQTASTYINNLLLARGLLRNGTPIEFSSSSKIEGAADATIVKVINLVHDIILRRDRELDTLSTVSQNIQALRATTTQQIQTIARLEARATKHDQQIMSAIVQQHAAEETLRGAESRNRLLREEMGKLKLTVAQIRGQCANDIRKRDNEIKRLKKHLEGRRGREGAGGQAGVVLVSSAAKHNQSGNHNAQVGASEGSPTNSLKQDTMNHLAELSQKLASENDALLGLAKATLTTLRDLQGLPTESNDFADASTGDPNVFTNKQPTYEEVARDMNETLEHLQALLTNPSFVPIEEVAIREHEIERLRGGWEKMESRWREAVGLMNGWKSRMLEAGDTINLEDLRRGLTLGADMPARPERDVEEELGIHHDIGERSLSLDTEAWLQAGGEGCDSTLSIPDMKSALSIEMDLGTGLFPPPKALAPTSGNARHPVSQQKVTWHASKAIDNVEEAAEAEDDISLLNFAVVTPSKRNGYPRRQSIHKKENPETPLTVKQKLARAEIEAREALKHEQGKGKEMKRVPSRIPKSKAHRRRSTLSREELEDLIGGNLE